MNDDYIKGYADRFIQGHYDDISPKFKAINDKMSETSSYSALDKLHDVLLSLYDTKEEFKTYRSFEKWAMKKFTQK